MKPLHTSRTQKQNKKRYSYYTGGSQITAHSIMPCWMWVKKTPHKSCRTTLFLHVWFWRIEQNPHVHCHSWYALLHHVSCFRSFTNCLVFMLARGGVAHECVFVRWRKLYSACKVWGWLGSGQATLLLHRMTSHYTHRCSTAQQRHTLPPHIFPICDCVVAMECAVWWCWSSNTPLAI